jgi:hypothetical protein
MKNIISGLMLYDIQQSIKKLGWEKSERKTVSGWEPRVAYGHKAA